MIAAAVMDAMALAERFFHLPEHTPLAWKDEISRHRARAADV